MLYSCPTFAQIQLHMRHIYLPLFAIIMLVTSCGSERGSQGNAETITQPSAPPQSQLGDAGTQQLMTVVSDYYALKDALVATNATQADAAATKLTESIEALRTQVNQDSAASASFATLLDTIGLGTRQILEEKDETTEKKRVHFEKVSDAMYALLKQAELKNAGVYRQYCPMAFDDKGAYWLSNETEIRNPYFGKKMLECGEVTDSLK